MKRVLILALAALLLGCNRAETPEAIRSRISTLREQSLKLNHQINELEQKLSTLEENDGDKRFVPVKVKELEKERFQHFFLTNAHVEPIEEAQISPEGAGGKIKTIHVSKGQAVSRGDLLVSLNTSVIDNSIAEVQLGLNLASRIYEKQKGLWEQNIGSELQYLEAKNAKESLERKLKTLDSQKEMAYLRAPFAGIVDDIFLKEGELASPGRSVLYLVNINRLRMRADVSETLLPSISVGDPVSVSFPSYLGLEFTAPIHRIGKTIDPKTRTISVELRIDNVNGKIRPNQMAMLRIRDFDSGSALVVPSIVVKQDDRGAFLFVVRSNENGMPVAQKQYVETGLSYNDQTMVLSGVQQGDKVITAGFNQVVSGTPIVIR